MKVIDLIKSYLNNASNLKYTLEANYLSTDNIISVRVIDSSRCYTYNNDRYPTNKPLYNICLGTTFYESTSGVSSSFIIPLDKEEDFYKEISLLYDGVFYHELGHVLYTPMKYVAEVFNYLKDQEGTQFASLLSQVSNIIEDIVIEGEIKAYNPHTKSSINYLKKIAFKEDSLSEISNDLKGALDVILYNNRVVSLKSALKFPDPDIDKMLVTYTYICINTPDPIKRFHRIIAFTAALWDVFMNNEKPHYKNYKNGLDHSFYTNLPSKYKDKDNNEIPNVTDNITSNIEDTAKDISNTVNNTLNTTQVFSTEDIDVDDEAKDIEKEAIQICLDNVKENDNSSKLNINIDQQTVFKDAREDIKYSNLPHTYCHIPSKENTSKYLFNYNNIVQEYHGMILKIYNIIKKKKAWNNTHWEEGKTSGKLNDKAFYKRTHKIYKQRSLPKKEADLAISILVDNSGSMFGDKSVICGKAMIVLAEVCNKLKIPFEINAFTFGNIAVTLGLKSFKDDYNKVKTALALIPCNVDLSDYSMFCSNVDEVNLNFVWKNFRKRPEKDKILIVISDGYTCGSEEHLRKVVSDIEKDGIQVLGLGIKSDAVANIYKQHKLFNTENELQELPAFLNNYLLRNIFKERNDF